MNRRRQAKADPMEQEIELALNPGAFIPYNACFSFVSDLDEVAAKIAKFIASNPSRAVGLYETFLAASYAKAEEIDDSSGSFGQFVDELYCGWIKARQADGANPEETASRLIAWMDDDEYGFCYRIEKDAVEVLDKANLAAFVAQIRARFDAATKAPLKKASTLKDQSDYNLRHYGAILRTLYVAQKDIAAYITLAESTGLTAPDCHAIATLFASRRKPTEALAWVDRGIALDKKTPHGSIAGHHLAELKRKLLSKLGRGKEALAAAWSDYVEAPNTFTYEDLMKYAPKAERAKWHKKAIDAAKGADLHSAMDLLFATKEMNRLADLVRQATDQALEDLSHYTTEPVATKFEKTHPDLAARMWRAQGLRIVNAKKSKYYDAALSNLGKAKRCFERAGLGAEWQKTVSQVRADHHRKSGFIPGFERLVGGTGPRKRPSFLEQAKERWSARQGRKR